MNEIDRFSHDQLPWYEATSEFNCFQNGMMALIKALDKKSISPDMVMPRIWVTTSEENGDHAYVEWKGKVFNKGTTAVEGSGFYIGPDLNIEELQEQGVDKTVELLREFETALEGGRPGPHNFRSMLSDMNMDRDEVLKLVKSALQES